MFYWLMLFFVSTTAFVAKGKIGNSITVLAAIITAGFIAPGVSQDYYNYLNGYYLTTPSLYTEPLSKIIFRLSFQLNQPITVSFLIFAIISLMIKYNALIKLNVPISVFFLVYCSKLYLLLDLTQVRAGVAVAICLIALFYRVNGRNKLSLLYIIIGFLFHYSAIMFLMIFLFSKKHANNAMWLCGVVLSILFSALDIKGILTSLFITLHVPTNYLAYLSIESDFKVNPFSILSILNLMIFVIFSFYKGLNNDVLFNLCYKLYGMSIISFYLFLHFPVLSFRISEFFLIYQILLIGLAYNKTIVNQRWFFLVLLTSYSALQLYMTYNVAQVIMPYKFV
ncbi:TPA: EpsG family protein [Escherichia coli]|uniref:EpsG family protein n=1 Tax=Escherichia coli TaxID=562 RepID=UPI000D6A4B0A|nr:EpsG family protein [Escherichia coli]QHN45984.1 EpsG family protein [Salmonella sp. S13]EFE8886108.1 EpsG family protein [Escherichia coli]EFJ3010216.1 EpsG family protein [Escherichia coli]EFM1308532.1 EpsG family protein [Escherichia coli]EHZ5797241.1 EpsG family protein [Escherichia coli]